MLYNSEVLYFSELKSLLSPKEHLDGAKVMSEKKLTVYTIFEHSSFSREFSMILFFLLIWWIIEKTLCEKLYVIFKMF
jgi:hypothetical protein